LELLPQVWQNAAIVVLLKVHAAPAAIAPAAAA